MNRIEQLFLTHCRALGLPEPKVNYRFAEGIGRRYEADFAFLGHKLLVEIQGGIWRRGGGAHSRPTNIVRDVEKAQCAALLGFRMVPVTTAQVSSGQAVNLVRQLIADAS